MFAEKLKTIFLSAIIKKSVRVEVKAGHEVNIVIEDVYFNAFDRVVSMCCFLISLPFASLFIDVCSFARGSV